MAEKGTTIQAKSVTYEEGLTIVLSDVIPTSSEVLPLRDCLGRTLAKDLIVDFSQPPFDRSPLDGYALIAADTVGATRATPVHLRQVFRTFAGETPERPIGYGECARVMTGSQLPVGANCVIRQEDTAATGDTVSIFTQMRPHENYVSAGDDFHAGDLILPSGSLLDAISLAVAASAGKAELAVHRRVRAAVIATGDEIVEPGKPLPEGKIYNSNLTFGTSRLKEKCVEVLSAVSAGDGEQAITDAILQVVDKVDIVLTSGGVSVGEKDLIPGILQALGAEIRFKGVHMKPGMPTLYALLGNSHFFGLSGNPFAAAVGLELLCVPLLRAMTSLNPQPDRVQATLSSDFGKPVPVRRFLRGKLKGGYVTLPDGHSSGVMRSMVGCNCLVDVPAGAGPLHAGDLVSVLLL